MRTTLAVLVLGFIVGGCATSSDEILIDDESAVEQHLVLEDTELGVRGALVRGEDILTFESEQIAPNVFDLWIEVNGLTLTAVIQPRYFAADHDGFVSDTGRDTNLCEPDRVLINALADQLSVERPNENGTAAAVLKNVALVWGEMPDAHDLQMEILSDMNRSVDRICPYFKTFRTYGHDCWRGEDDNMANRRPLAIGWHGRSTDNYTIERTCNKASGSYAWNDNSTYKNHDWDGWPKMGGACFARCGANCPGSTENQVLTADCAIHDLCAFMHGTNFGDCQDEFNGAVDDTEGGTDNCNDTRVANDWGSNAAPCP